MFTPDLIRNICVFNVIMEIRMSRTSLSALSAALILSSALMTDAGAQTNCFRVGLNGGTAKHVFINLFTVARMFSPKQHQVPCDEQGYPLSVPFTNKSTGEEETKITYLIANFPSPTLFEDSVYVLKWDGEGEFQISSWFPRSVTAADCQNEDPYHRTCYPVKSSSGRMEFKIKYNPDDQKFRNIQFELKSSTKGNHVRNIRLYLKSFENAYENEGKVFNPLYLEKLEPFYMIRFMGAFKTNNCSFRTWDHHTPKDYWNQSSGPHNQGLSYEWAVELCNKAQKHLWFNVPHAADEYSIRRMAEIVRDNLDPNLMVYLEYSNETWNCAPPYREQFEYVKSRGGWVDGHVKLSMNMFNIWKDVFGRERHRIKHVMATYGFDGKRRVEECGLENFDVYSPTYYWNATKDDKEEWDENTSVDEMISSIQNNIRGGPWYQKMLKYSNQARLYGKELYCYEGGMGGDPGDSIPSRWSVPVYPYWRSFQKLQKDPRLVPFIHELVDSLTSLGYSGGNELSLTGSWQYHPITRRISFWGMINDLYDIKEEFPKFQGMMDKVKDCDQLSKQTDTTGSGLAILLDGHDDYIDGRGAFKPDDSRDDYTFEFWIRPELMGYKQALLTLFQTTGSSLNTIYLGTDNRIFWNILDDVGSPVIDIHTMPLQIGKYYHIAGVKNGNTYKVYINGSEKASGTGNPGNSGSRDRIIFGASVRNGQFSDHFRGRMDEIRLWSKPLSLLNIRQYMCSKIPQTHPSYSALENLYRFDSASTSNNVPDLRGGQDALLQRVNYTHYSNYVKSGAPIGDESRFVYPSTWSGVALGIEHYNGDLFTVKNMGKGNPEGVHVYLVDQAPNDQNLPGGTYARYYFGVFTAGGTEAEYNAVYRFKPPPTESNNDYQLLKRDNNAEKYRWRNSGALLNNSTYTLSTREGTERYQGEYLFGMKDGLISSAQGAGYCLQFDGEENTRAEMWPYVRPDEEYTVSLWYRNFSKSGYLVRFENLTGSSDQTYLKVSYGNSLYFRTGPNSGTITGRHNYKIDDTGWNHVALVKKDGMISVYSNGMETDIKDLALGMNADGSVRDSGFLKMYLGEHFEGMIDEVRLWDKALDLSTIRQWMCRRMNVDHPFQEASLVTHFTFDKGSGSDVKDLRGTGKMELVGGVSWIPSGAPLGDTSSFTYDSDMLSIAHPDGDSLLVDISDEENWSNYRGIHLYRADSRPFNSSYPSRIRSVDSSRYYGVFIIPYHKHSTKACRYTSTYRYSSNQNVTLEHESSLRLLSRDNGSVSQWLLHEDTPDESSHSINVSMEFYSDTVDGRVRWRSRPAEFQLASLDSGAIDIQTSPPPDPQDIQGPSAVCAGQESLVYHVPEVKDADYYIWQLPDGVTGYSETDTIVVSVTAGTSGAVGELKVKAGNRWGTSGWSTLALHVELSPSLTTEIDGPTEVCSEQKSVVYGIEPVENTEQYIWKVSGDAEIFPNGTSAKVDFGDQNTVITVYGMLDCGKVVLNTKAITINRSPRLDLLVEGNRVCKDVELYATVYIFQSEPGVRYRAYKNNGTSPVGHPAYGTGGQAEIKIPIEDLLAGENMLTIKAKKGNCNEISLSAKASVIIDVTPDPDLKVELENGPLCRGDTAVFVIHNSPSGVEYQAFVDYDWTIDSKPPYEIEPVVVSKGGDTRVKVNPAPYHNQMAGRGVALGPNRVWFTARMGRCRTITLKDTVKFTVPHSPRSMNVRGDTNFLSYWKVPIPLEDTIDVTVSSHAYEDDGSRRYFSLCSDEEMILRVDNAEIGVTYSVWLYDSENGPLQISDDFLCSQDRSSVEVRIPPNTFDRDTNSLRVHASNSTCTAILHRNLIALVEPSPDTKLPVSDYTVCGGSDAEVRVERTSENVVYELQLIDGDFSSEKSGNDTTLVFTVPFEKLSMGENKLIVRAWGEFCSPVVLSDTAKVYKVDQLSDDLTTEAQYCTLCGGVDAEIWVHNPQPGVEYTAFIGSDKIGETVEAQGDSIMLFLPADSLQTYGPGSISVQIKARAGSCEVDLVNAVEIEILDKSYPTGRVQVRDHDQPYICPDEGDPVFLKVNERNFGKAEYHPIRLFAVVDGRIVGEGVLADTIPTNHNSDGDVLVPIPREYLPYRDTVDIRFAAKMEGCPPKIIRDYDCWRCRFTSDRNPFYIASPYKMDPEVIGDTICSDQIGKVVIVDPMRTGDGAEEVRRYRLWDPVKERAVTNTIGTYHWSMDKEGNLPLTIINNDYLEPGDNVFDIQAAYFGGWNEICGWVTLDSKAVIVINSEPERTLDVRGTSICGGDMTVEVDSTQEGVYYQVYLGNRGVSESKEGNGGTLKFTVESHFLSSGANEVSVRATVPGCSDVALDKRIILEVTDTPPAEPGLISGPTEICAGSGGIEYTVPNDRNASSYTWILPDGATTISESNVAQVDFGVEGGEIRVKANNVCGSSPASEPLLITALSGARGGMIEGPQRAASGDDIVLKAMDYTGEIIKWQWSEYPGIWNDIYDPSQSITYAAGERDVTFRIVVSSSRCGQVYSSKHTVDIDSDDTVPQPQDTAAVNHRIHYGPTLFCPEEREFLMIIEPDDRTKTLESGSQASIIIYSGSGDVVHQKSFIRSENRLKVTWEGRNMRNRLVSQGTYLALVKYKINGRTGVRKFKIGIKR